MPDSAVEKNTQPAPARETLPARPPIPEPKQSPLGGEHMGIYASFREIAAASAGQEPPPESFSPFFRKSEFAHPANDAQRARVLGELQEQYGNRYIQRVLAPGAPALTGSYAGMILQRREAQGTNGAMEHAPQLEQGGGQPLDSRTQDFMGARFNQNFDNVRVHDDGQAHRAARALNAEAFTTGRDIYFSQGAYNPTSESGRKLLAHELTHVVQQNRGAAGVSTSGFNVSHPSDPSERQADEVSRAVIEGSRPGSAGLLSASFGAGRVAQTYPYIQRFAGAEHEQLGNVTGVGEIDLGNGVVLSWGQMIALAGDHYESIEKLLDDTKTDDGKRRIRASLEHYGSPAANVATMPAPTPDDRGAVETTFAVLALQNIPHFSAGGSARDTWLGYHTRAIDAAIGAGLTNDVAGKARAYALEAFGQHFLTDSFSAGHVRTPRREIAEWYVDVFAPRVIDHFINHLRQRFIDDIYVQVARQSRAARIFEGAARERIRNDLNVRIDRGLARKEVGGRAGLIRWVGLAVGGAISGVIHDAEGKRGLVVTSLARPEPWHTVGDARLNEGSAESGETKAEVEKAVGSAKQDVDAAFNIARGENEFRLSAPKPTKLPQRIHFGFDRSDLNPAANTVLTGAAAYLVYNPGAFVTLTGHTDQVGRRDYNRDLGSRRAETVLNFMTSLGVDAARVTAASRGEDMPLTNDPRQFRLNRRVELSWGERPATASDNIGRDRATQAVRKQVGPPYKAESFIPTAVPGQNEALPDWHWGSIPAGLRADISAFAVGALSPRVGALLAAPDLDPLVIEGNNIEPRPIARAVVNEILADPLGFLGRAFGEGAGP